MIVTVKKLNKRSAPPLTIADNNIVGSVEQGFSFDGEEIKVVPNPHLGKWYRDQSGSCYWGGGLAVVPPMLNVSASEVKKPLNIPVGAKMGFDLSHHNDPDWSAIVAAGFSFVFIKITDGVGTQDMKAKEHVLNAKKNGMKIGYYHFAHPDFKSGGTVTADAESESNFALQIMSGLTPPDLPLVLDLENENMPLNKENFLLWVKTFLGVMESAPGSMPPIIYSTKAYLESKLPTTHDLGSHKLWVANYSQTDCDKLKIPSAWENWAMWQYTDSAVIGGNGKLDLNIMKDTTLL